MTVQGPVLNINGSSGTELLEGHKKAYLLIREVIECEAALRPHGRDYQTAPEGCYRQALEEHERRMAALRQIEQDHRAIALQIQQQQMARRRPERSQSETA